MSKEVATIIVNGIIALAMMGAAVFGPVPWPYALAGVLLLAIPSAAPELAKYAPAFLKAALERPSPPKGPSVVFLLLTMGVAVTPTSCSPAAAPRQELPSYCYDEQKLEDELVKCVEHAKVLAESRGCRAQVNSSCGFKAGVQ